MQRRKFLRNTSAVSIAITSFFTNSTSARLHKERQALFNDNFELNEATIDILQQAMQSGKYTSRSITEMYLKRIQSIDKSGPKLNAVIELNPEALNIADAMDAE